MKTTDFVPITLIQSGGACPIRRAELKALVGAEAITGGACHIDVRTAGPRQIPVSVAGIAVTNRLKDLKHATYVTVCVCVCGGGCTMTRPKESGYHLEGQVSHAGRKVRAITSSQLFELEDGRLVNVGTLHLCLPSE